MGKNKKGHPLKQSFKHSFRGVLGSFRTERNLKIHFIIAILVVLTGWLFAISKNEWILIVFAIGIVIISEMINTAIEKILDLSYQDFNGKVRFIKDVFAGVVLVSAMIAVFVGSTIFIPKILALF